MDSKLQKWAETTAGLSEKPDHWLFYYDYIFRGVSFEGKFVLDIGGGVGRSSYFAAASGASSVVCIEPEAAGSHGDMLKRAADFGDRAGLRDVVKFVAKPLQDAALDEQFDIVMLLNSINHIAEEACVSLRHNVASRTLYVELLSDIAKLCKPGGTIVVTDCSNENLFGSRGRLGWYNPFAPSVEYWKHQTPELWAELLAIAGFNSPTIRWTPDRRSGKFGERWLTSRAAAYCLQSHFVLTMKRTS